MPQGITLQLPWSEKTPEAQALGVQYKTPRSQLAKIVEKGREQAKQTAVIQEKGKDERIPSEEGLGTGVRGLGKDLGWRRGEGRKRRLEKR